MSLHTVVTRVSRATSPLQRSDRFVGHLVHWFVQQSIPEEGTQMLLKSLSMTFFGPLIRKISFRNYEHQFLHILFLIIMNLLESWTFLTPGAFIIFCFYIWCCPLLHSEGHCLFYNIGTMVPSRDRDKRCQKNILSCDDCIFEILDRSKKHIKIFKGGINSDLLVPAGRLSLTMMMTESSVVRVELKWSVEFTFHQ